MIRWTIEKQRCCTHILRRISALKERLGAEDPWCLELRSLEELQTLLLSAVAWNVKRDSLSEAEYGHGVREFSERFSGWLVENDPELCSWRDREFRKLVTHLKRHESEWLHFLYHKEVDRPVLKQSKGSRAVFYATQRHYRSQRSKPIVDGRIEADLRTCVRRKNTDVKYQPEWMESIYNVLIKKKSNIQCGIEVRLDYSCSVVRSPDAVDLFADSWNVVWPLLDFVLSDD